MRTIERIFYWHNKAADSKFIWFPFHFLKPATNQPIGIFLKLKMILCFGIYYGAFAGIRNALFSDAKLLVEVTKGIGWGIVIFTVWFNLVTAPLWNLRANKLNSKIQ